jgi:protoheme IX farnesyltransferase
MKSKAQSLYLVEAAGRQASWVDVLRSYGFMTKPTISMFVVVTVIPSLIMAKNSLPDPIVAIVALLGTFLAAGSAGMFNHLVDAKYDKVMDRTKTRPIPAGEAFPGHVKIVATVLGLIGFAMLYRLTTPLAAWIALAANAFYVLIYTMYLKPRTEQNIVIGGAAGSVGPLIGWAAVTGDVALPAWIMFLIVFLWTPPHFWALAIKYKDDYKKAGIPMLPWTKGVWVTKRAILIYTFLLLPAVMSLFFLQAASYLYLAVSGALTLWFFYLSYQLFRSRSEKGAMKVFYFSLVYILGVFASLTIDRILSLY